MIATSRHRYLPRQHGVALLMALVFLVVLTLMGVGVFSSTTAEEKIARNFRDREIALNAAQSAVDTAEARIKSSYDSNHPPSTLPPLLTKEICSGSKKPAGVSCLFQTPSDLLTKDLFAANSGAVELGDVDSALYPKIIGLSAQPRYLIYLMRGGNTQSGSTPCGDIGSDKNCFIVLAQAQGRIGTTRVNLIEYFVN